MDIGVDLIDLYRLETSFQTDLVEHHSTVSDRSQGLRRVSRVTKWATERELGAGSFGTVCLQKEQHGALRAVKEIRKEVRGTRQLYLRELLAMAFFTKEKASFVEFKGWYENENRIFIAMEYFELGDLQKCVLTPLPEGEAKLVICQVAEALKFMHERHFTHRDLTPQNVFVVKSGPDWWVKLADFGISKRVNGDATSLNTIFLGASVAPEIIDPPDTGDHDQDEYHYTNSVDIWSLGWLSYWLLTKGDPFPTSNKRARYRRGTAGFPDSPLKASGVSLEGIKFIQNCMAIDPQCRPSAEEVLQLSWLQDTSHASSTQRGNSLELGVCKEDCLLRPDLIFSDVDASALVTASTNTPILYVDELNPSVDEAYLRRVFGHKLEFVKLLRDEQTGRSLCAAYIGYNAFEDANEVLVDLRTWFNYQVAYAADHPGHLKRVAQTGGVVLGPEHSTDVAPFSDASTLENERCPTTTDLRGVKTSGFTFPSQDQLRNDTKRRTSTEAGTSTERFKPRKEGRFPINVSEDLPSPNEAFGHAYIFESLYYRHVMSNALNNGLVTDGPYGKKMDWPVLTTTLDSGIILTMEELINHHETLFKEMDKRAFRRVRIWDSNKTTHRLLSE